MTQNSKYFGALDIIRIIGCLCIVTYHYSGAGSYNLISNLGFFEYLVKNGNSFLDFFFMVSGFCIAVNYSEKISNHLISFKEFFLKHYFVFVGYSIITLPLAITKEYMVFKTGCDEFPMALKVLLDAMCIRTGYGSIEQPYNSPLWFINILLQVYAVFFVFSYFTKNKRKSIVCIVFILVGFSIYRNRQEFPILYVVSQAIMNFFLGVLLYEIYTNVEIKHKHITNISLITLIISSTVIICNYMSKDINVIFDYRPFLSFMFWPATIWLGATISEHISKASRCLKFLSKFATSVFIWHHPLIYIIRESHTLGYSPFDINEPRTVFLYAVLLCIIALVSNVFLERHIVHLISKPFMQTH